MRTTPRIFVALVFRAERDLVHVHATHYVAAFTSTGAEKLLRANGHIVEGLEVFLQTDGALDDLEVHGCSTAVQTAGVAKPVPHEAHANWVRVMTRPSSYDGERLAAPFRRLVVSSKAARPTCGAFVGPMRLFRDDDGGLAKTGASVSIVSDASVDFYDQIGYCLDAPVHLPRGSVRAYHSSHDAAIHSLGTTCREF